MKDLNDEFGKYNSVCICVVLVTIIHICLLGAKIILARFRCAKHSLLCSDVFFIDNVQDICKSSLEQLNNVFTSPLREFKVSLSFFENDRDVQHQTLTNVELDESDVAETVSSLSEFCTGS